MILHQQMLLRQREDHSYALDRAIVSLGLISQRTDGGLLEPVLWTAHAEAHVYATERAGLLYSRGGAGHTRGFSPYFRQSTARVRHSSPCISCRRIWRTMICVLSIPEWLYTLKIMRTVAVLSGLIHWWTFFSFSLVTTCVSCSDTT